MKVIIYTTYIYQEIHLHDQIRVYLNNQYYIHLNMYIF